MLDFDGKNIELALPSTPVEILGMNDTALAGAEFLVTENENEAKKVSEFKKNNSSQKNNLLSKDKATLFDNK